MDALYDAIKELAEWLLKDCKVWGDGATFDISILEDAYLKYGIEIPWKSWNVRDCCTVPDMYKTKRGVFNKTVNRKGVHNALEDAKFQAQYITMVCNRLLGEQK